MWALIINSAVAELTDLDPTGRFIPSFDWVAVPTGVSPEPGWSYSGGVFTAPPAAPAPMLAQQAAAMLAAGLAVSSISDNALDATYSTTSDSQQHIQAEVTAILLNGTFADGTSSLAWLDAAGGSHTFTVAQFKTMATAVAAFVSACLRCMNGQSTTLPSASATIA